MAKKKQGFAAIPKERRREIAAMGGRSQSRKTNPGNFAHDPKRAAAASRKRWKKQR